MNHGMGFFNEAPQVTLTARDPYNGDKLLQNQSGSFVDVTESAGINSTAIGYGLGVAVEDFNRDGWPDLYVSNDFLEHDYLYLNQQDGTFRESIHTATRHISNYSMGNDAADINNDGWPDVIVVDMVAEDNRRLKANMKGAFDKSRRAGVFDMTGRGCKNIYLPKNRQIPLVFFVGKADLVFQPVRLPFTSSSLIYASIYPPPSDPLFGRKACGLAG
jgi:hypothetical protein